MKKLISISILNCILLAGCRIFGFYDKKDNLLINYLNEKRFVYI